MFVVETTVQVRELWCTSVNNDMQMLDILLFCQMVWIIFLVKKKEREKPKNRLFSNHLFIKKEENLQG